MADVSLPPLAGLAAKGKKESGRPQKNILLDLTRSVAGCNLIWKLLKSADIGTDGFA